MGRIVYLCGKSASGKDTVFRELMKRGTLQLKTIVPYTTRPVREGEQNGREYFFVDEETFQQLLSQGKIIEHREYHTVHGLWRYFTVDDSQIDLSCNDDYIVIGTLEGYEKMLQYFGEGVLLPVLIELDDGIRLQRALERERQQKHPKYEEMCRRFLADSRDFSEERIKAAGIRGRFENNDLEECLAQIERYIKAE